MVFLNPAMVAHNLTKVVDKHLHYDICTKLLVGVVSLSAFGGNFVLDKVRLGSSASVSSELRGVCINQVQVICPLCTKFVRFSEGPLLEVLL